MNSMYSLERSDAFRFLTENSYKFLGMLDIGSKSKFNKFKLGIMRIFLTYGQGCNEVYHILVMRDEYYDIRTYHYDCLYEYCRDIIESHVSTHVSE